MGKEPECARLLTQTELSLRAIRLYLINYQLQLLRLSLPKTITIVDVAKNGEKK